MAPRLLFLVLLVTGLLRASAQAQINTLTVLHVNDTHSNLATLGPRSEDLSGPRGGIARAASLIGLQRATNPNTLLLHAGDLFVGDLFFNKAEVRFPLVWRLGGVVGFDAGNVWHTVNEIGWDNWKSNPVAGLRLQMDTFIVRLDIGFGTDATGFFMNFGHLL